MLLRRPTTLKQASRQSIRFPVIMHRCWMLWEHPPGIRSLFPCERIGWIQEWVLPLYKNLLRLVTTTTTKKRSFVGFSFWLIKSKPYNHQQQHEGKSQAAYVIPPLAMLHLMMYVEDYLPRASYVTTIAQLHPSNGGCPPSPASGLRFQSFLHRCFLQGSKVACPHLQGTDVLLNTHHNG